MGITKVCGRPQEREIAGVDVTIYPLFHPAAALRAPRCLELLREHMTRRSPALLERAARGRAAPRAGARGARGGAGEASQLGLFG